MTAQKTSINLLPKDRFEGTPAGRFIKWSLAAGKYILIFTQLIVIVAFVYRFKLDRNLDTLNEGILQHQDFIVANQELEHQARIIQDQLDILKNIGENQVLMGSTLATLGEITPLEVEFETLSLSQKLITIKGVSLTEVGLATLINEILKNPSFEKVNIRSISSGGFKDPILNFEMSFVNTAPSGEKE